MQPKGDVYMERLELAALANYQKCLKEGRKGQIRICQSHYTRPGKMKCDCGEILEMWGGGRDIYCEKCSRDYNSAGQELAPRSQWGEETGETAMDYFQGINER